MGLARIRPANWGFQAEFQGKLASWGMRGYTPGTGECLSLGLTLTRTPQAKGRQVENLSSPLLWEVTAEWNQEKADPWGHLNYPPTGSEVTRNWWRLVFKIGI